MEENFTHILVLFKKVNDMYVFNNVVQARIEEGGFRVLSSVLDESDIEKVPLSSRLFFNMEKTKAEINNEDDIIYWSTPRTRISEYCDKKQADLESFVSVVYGAFKEIALIRDKDCFLVKKIYELKESDEFVEADDENELDSKFEPESDIDPKEIIEKIKKKFIAQESVVESVVSNIYINQLLINRADRDLISTSKSVILIDGPTGTGKTAIIKETCEKLNLPVVITKSTDYSASGYVGSSLNEILVQLLQKAKGNLELAQRGIVCMDEIDKLAGENKKEELVMKRAVQQDLLTFIGGSKYLIQNGLKRVEFDTTNLTFIGMGAFTRLIDEKKEKLNKKFVGFDTIKKAEENTYTINNQDYVDFGLERELVGRMTTIIHTNAYTKEDFKKIMLESEISPLKMFIKTLNVLGVEKVSYDDEFIDEVASMALEAGFGVRGLQKIFSDIKNLIMMDIIYNKIRKIELNSDILNKIREKNIRKF